MLHLACAKELDGFLDTSRSTDDNEIVTGMEDLFRSGCGHGILTTDDRNNRDSRACSDTRIADRAVRVDGISTHWQPVDDETFDALLKFGQLLRNARRPKELGQSARVVRG